ncbi:MAG: 3-isopropylmalate dehydratase [Candidatus Bipolaricaulia bacterium]
MSTLYRGRVWKFGDHINTDLIMPGDSMYGKVPKEEMKYHAFKAIRPEFARQVRSGDIIVAGKNFGSGSSRPATRILKDLGISCIVAESFAQLFFRNSINMGYPVLICTGVTGLFEDGDEAEVELLSGRVTNLKTGQSLQAEPLPPFILRLIEAGGILALLKRGERLKT